MGTLFGLIITSIFSIFILIIGVRYTFFMSKKIKHIVELNRMLCSVSFKETPKTKTFKSKYDLYDFLKLDSELYGFLTIMKIPYNSKGTSYYYMKKRKMFDYYCKEDVPVDKICIDIKDAKYWWYPYDLNHKTEDLLEYCFNSIKVNIWWVVFGRKYTIYVQKRENIKKKLKIMKLWVEHRTPLNLFRAFLLILKKK